VPFDEACVAPELEVEDVAGEVGVQWWFQRVSAWQIL
jgi:hypothetical protein